MNRSLLQAKILENLGGALVSSVISVKSLEENEGDLKQDAIKTATLLSKSTQISTAIAKYMNLKAEDETSDAVRVSLAVLSAQIISEFFRKFKKVPEENDIQKMIKSLEATLTFSDNFIASENSIKNNEALEHQLKVFNENSTTIWFIGALVPVLNAVSEFSFGKPENVLIQEIADRLTLKARSLKEEMFGEEQTEQSFLAELSILKSLVEIYVECHKKGIEGLKVDRKAAPEGQPIDLVWRSFEANSKMMEVLVGNMLPDRKSVDVNAAPVVKAPSSQVDEVKEQAEPKADIQKEEIAGPPLIEKEVQAETQQNNNEQSANPMSFFKTPENEDDNDEGDAGTGAVGNA